MFHFGPNTVSSDKLVSNSSSHRSSNFKELFADTRRLFYEKFPFLDDFYIIFIPGSGSVGIESVVYSLESKIEKPRYRGRFAERWSNLIDCYNYNKSLDETISLEVQFETSLSVINNVENIKIVDGISSFPYYNFPSTADFFVTCTNKQIGSLVGLSIVFIRKEAVIKLRPSDESYLSLRKYIEFAENNQTPYTFPEFLIKDLKSTLEKFDIGKLKTKIEDVSGIIFKKVPPEFIKGTNMPAPAISLDLDWFKTMPDLSLGYYNKYTESVQIFTYSEPVSAYQKLFSTL
jgi:aspartate aminotransferase-like enzyme